MKYLRMDKWISEKVVVQLLVQGLKAFGIRDIILSPGSRNAPLSLSLTSDCQFSCESIVDERCAAFYALGMAQATKTPAAVCSTSGSAVLNYAPAISEAFYQEIPLLVITADRPIELIDQGDGQTIRQKNIYSNYIKKSIELPQDIHSRRDEYYINRLINEALIALTDGVPGPVHINIPLREPLYNRVRKENISFRKIEASHPSMILEGKQWQDMLQEWNTTDKIMILTGQFANKNPELEEALNTLAKQENVVVMTETTSNFSKKDFISCIDRSLQGIRNTADFEPSLLITIGGQVISKRIKKWLRQKNQLNHWHIHPSPILKDSYYLLSRWIKMPAFPVIDQLAKKGRGNSSGYKTNWQQLEKETSSRHRDFLANAPFCDLKAFEIILNDLPFRSNLHMANSSPVRYVQLFDQRPDITYFSNRGTSGIDGQTSTAAGYAKRATKVNTLISGDIGFFYDSNAFWNNELPKNLRVIVINNGGGGIFRFIEGPPENKQQLDYFETPHHLKIERFASTFDIPYYCSENEKELLVRLKEFFDGDEIKILEVKTPRLENTTILKKYFKKLKPI